MIDYFPDAPQDQMIMDAMDELNRQAEGDQEPLAIAAFGTQVLVLTPADRHIPQKLIDHNLGAAPIFQVFKGDLAGGGISPIPVVDAISNGAGDLIFGGTINAFADSSSIWIIYDDQLPTDHQIFTYLIFSGAIQNNS